MSIYVGQPLYWIKGSYFFFQGPNDMPDVWVTRLTKQRAGLEEGNRIVHSNESQMLH